MENNIIKIETPKKFILNGIFIGSEKAENIFIYLHGLGGNLFGLKFFCIGSIYLFLKIILPRNFWRQTRIDQ